jgi:stress-induced morphogen
MLFVLTSTLCLHVPASHHRSVARPKPAHRNVRFRAAFDERPTEPITSAQQQISQELMKSMEISIGEALETDNVSVTDVFGDNQHVKIQVVSDKFEGLTAVKRQRLVYQVCQTHSMCVSFCLIS